MKYKHIVFDIDGTLIDTEYAILHSLQKKNLQAFTNYYMIHLAFDSKRMERDT